MSSKHEIYEDGFEAGKAAADRERPPVVIQAQSGTWITNLDRNLGRERAEAVERHQAFLVAHAHCLHTSIIVAPFFAWSDDALEAIKADARDLRAAANDYVVFACQLAHDLRAQRTEQQP